MKNFVVYSHVEYRLGNSLNLIIGPNGTGKSSLIAALCLGLGGKPEHLGARKLEDYIKTGCDSARIEIEVKAPKREARNYYITRTIGNKLNKWTLNGTILTQAKIMEIVRKLRIQVDNLCQFLPQERVSDFAELNAQQRLRSTEQAIGSADLLNRHDKLIELSRKLDTSSRSTYEDEETLERLRDDLIDKNEQVEAITSYTNLKNEFDLLNEAIQVCELKDLAARRDQLKQTLDECRRQIEASKNRNELIKPRFEKSQSNLLRADRDFESTRDEIMVLDNTFESSGKTIGQLVNDLSDLKVRIPAIIKNARSYEINVQTLKSSLVKLERAKDEMEQRNGNLEIELEELNSKSRDIRHLQTENKNKQKDKFHELDDMNRNERRPLVNKIESCKNQLRDLTDAQKQKAALVEKLGFNGEGKAIVDAMRHLLKNKDKFSHEVHYPPFFSLTIKDLSCLSMFGSLMSQNAMSTFICESREDYLTFTKEIVDGLHLNVNVVEYSGSRFKTPEDHKHPIDRNLLTSKGFDGYLIDLLDAKPTVLNMLCIQEKVHAIPYSKSGRITTDKEKFLIDQNFTGRCVDSSKVVTYSRSAYGRRLLSSSSRNFKGSFWQQVFNTSSSESRRRELRLQLEGYQKELNVLEENIKQLQLEGGELRDEGEVLDAQATEINRRRQDIKDHSKRYGRLVSSIASKKEEISEKEADPPRIEEEIEKIEREITSKSEQLCEEFSKIGRVLDQRVDITSQSTSLDIRKNVSTYQVKVYENILRNSYEHLLKEEENIKTEGKKVVADIKKLKVQLSKIDPERYKELAAKAEEYESKHRLELEIESVKAKMELDSGNHMGNIEDIIRSRDHLQTQIEELEERIQNHENATSDLENSINEIARIWEPELVKLIDEVSEQFSRMFTRIGCQGKVVLNRTSKLYEEWSLDILVSFRESASLQVLNAQRQSGGERSVSTSLYLMSLQGLAKAPFRVVDEINQGMDPRNERMVHDLMVNIACADNTSQYFLVTPKLLRNLPYHKRMKVCCIYSGEKVTELAVKDLSINDTISSLQRFKEA